MEQASALEFMQASRASVTSGCRIVLTGNVARSDSACLGTLCVLLLVDVAPAGACSASSRSVVMPQSITDTPPHAEGLLMSPRNGFGLMRMTAAVHSFTMQRTSTGSDHQWDHEIETVGWLSRLWTRFALGPLSIPHSRYVLVSSQISSFKWLADGSAHCSASATRTERACARYRVQTAVQRIVGGHHDLGFHPRTRSSPK